MTTLNGHVGIVTQGRATKRGPAQRSAGPRRRRYCLSAASFTIFDTSRARPSLKVRSARDMSSADAAWCSGSGSSGFHTTVLVNGGSVGSGSEPVGSENAILLRHGHLETVALSTIFDISAAAGWRGASARNAR